MFEICSKKINFHKKNTILKRNIYLDENLDCFILISSDNENFGDVLLNNIVDLIAGKISKDNTYNDFGAALEHVNAVINTWKQDTKKDIKLDVVIGILNENNFIFSNIGEASCLLVNTNDEIVELTTKLSEGETKLENFNFISNGELQNSEIVILSTKRLLNYLSRTDILDGIDTDMDIKSFHKNIKNILLSEILEENMVVTALMSRLPVGTSIENNKITFIKEQALRLVDNNFSKKIIAQSIQLKEKIKAQSKQVKNGLFLTGIITSIFILYSILSTVIGVATVNEEREVAKVDLTQAKSYLKIASENIANPESFELNIKNAEEIISEIGNDKIFINDISKINDDINILKKQFNKIETIDSNNSKLLHSGEFTDAVKVIKNNLKPYVILKKGILGPIVPNIKPKKYSFNLEENDAFIDATILGSDIYLTTQSGKIVKFSKNSRFSYMDVKGQTSWEKSIAINSYGQNIYLIGEEDNQIYKHVLIGNSFNKGIPYLKPEDITQINGILSIAIDGGFYILKNDLSIIKFYNSPKYRLENIVINKLPKNYEKGESNTKIDLKTRNDLNYVYLLLDNKIWILKPNTTNYRDTKSLTYIGQIEGEKREIKDFLINHDGEIIILNESGIYKVNFEISDDKLTIR